MHKTAVAFAIGRLMQVMALALVAPLGISIFDNRAMPLADITVIPEVAGFWIAILFSLLAGTFLVVRFQSGKRLQGIKEGYAIVTFGWLALAFVGSLPLFAYFVGTEPNGWSQALRLFTDAFFEIMSGFTTTGATILADIEAVPRSILLLRALSQWLGGMGIITLAIVIFPAMGVSGYQMFRGEVPGPTTERLQPRLATTASILWGVYFLFSAVEAVLLLIGGMDLFDAICHTFATMASGGFSTRNASVAAFNSPFIEWVIIIFMYLAGVNFLLHYKALRGDFKPLMKNREFVFYTGTVLSAIVIITAVLYCSGQAPREIASTSFRLDAMTEAEFADHYAAQGERLSDWTGVVRVAAFQAISIITTTGFVTSDFDLWPNLLRFLLVALMFFGGCAGSTGGGMKMIRILMILKIGFNEIRKLTQPRLVAPVKMDGKAVDDKFSLNVTSFVLLFVGLFVITAGLMTIFVPDLTTAVSCSIATIGNVGPGLAGVGAVEHYACIPIPGKWILVFSMLLGRLEIFTVLIILRPATWRK